MGAGLGWGRRGGEGGCDFLGDWVGYLGTERVGDGGIKGEGEDERVDYWAGLFIVALMRCGELDGKILMVAII